jgi:CubicO group peptidase (beta-lactamase class C family)
MNRFLFWTDPDVALDPRSRKLTTRHILSHQTGFVNWRWLHPSKKLTFDFEPGTRYAYSGEGFEYLRRALEKKFGKTLDQLADSLIFRPLNMQDTRFSWQSSVDESRFALWHDKEGKLYETEKNKSANGADDLLTTLEDYGRFLVSVLNEEGLSKEVFREMVSPQVETKNTKHFGLGFEIYNFKDGTYALSHGGADKGVQTIFFIFPKTRQGLIIFTNVDDGYKVYEKTLFTYLPEYAQTIIDIETK